MSGLAERLSGLSPAKRRLLLERLEAERRRAPATGEADPRRIPRAPRGGDLPLSPAQERLWFLDQIDPGNPFYNIPMALRLAGGLAVATLARALSEVERRHEALRTTFVSVAGAARQRISPPRPVPLPVVDLEGLAERPRAIEARRLAEAEGLRPFDLAAGPLARFGVLRLAPREHVLLVTLHHVIADGWSLGVLVREVSGHYEAFSEGRPSPFPELPVQYADFAEWQRRALGGGELERQLDYWRRRLAGLPTLDLRADRPRSGRPSFRGRRDGVLPGLAVDAGVRSLQRREGHTLFMVVLAAFQALLSRYTGQEDVVVGSPIANRNRHEVEPLIGFFVNSLVLRTDLSGDPSFAELLSRVRETALGAYDHQDLPFEKLVEELNPPREWGRNPLFDVVCVVQNAPAAEARLRDLEIGPFGGAAATSKFDLQLDVWERGGRLQAIFQYKTDLFDPTTVARLAGQLWTLLAAAAADPERRVRELPLLPPAERHQLLVEWRQDPPSRDRAGWFREARSLAEAFRVQVEARPDAVALAAGEERLTYGGLAARARDLSVRLRALGAGPEARVGICLERSAELVVAILAVVEAGAVYVPIDPRDPDERLAFVVADAALAAVVGRDGLRERLPDSAVPVVAPDEGPLPRAAEAAANPRSVHTGRQAALYSIYTSGTTGRPKGVLVSHGNVLDLFAATDRLYAFTEDDTWTLFHSHAFDFSVWELWGALLHGGLLVVVPYWSSRSPEAFLDLLERERVTVLNQTPSAFRQLMEAEAAAAGRRAPALRHVVFGGEALDLPSLRPWFARHGDRRPRLVNMYGITETTVHVTQLPLAREHLELPAGSSRIGRPLAHLGAQVLDADLRPVPAGVPGELYVSGGGLARGYLGRPALAAERFLPDAAGEAPGGRAYRTGDLVRWRSEGGLEFLGRCDHQVKVRGFRIETGEIEAVLASHPGVREAAVMVRGDGDERRLVAYVVQAPARLAPEDQAARQRDQVERWEAVFEDTYGGGGRSGAGPADAPDLDVVGWDSSYTGSPIPVAEMREWVEETVAAIRALAPRRVLEIGCGTGLLLARVAPEVEHYVATDFSAQALAAAGRALAAAGVGAGRVELLARGADDVSGLAPESFDLVVLNSVVQYFPGADYLERVLAGALEVLRPGGAIYVGDVRSLPLLEAFHASVELYRAPDDLPVAELVRRVERRLLEENELVLDPGYFAALARRMPAIEAVEVVPKRGRADHEMNRFRYQVVLRKRGGAGSLAPVPARWLDWAEGAPSDQDLAARIGDLAPGQALGLAGVPNARTAEAVAAAELVARGEAGATAGELRRRVAETVAGSAARRPEDLVALGESLGCRVELGWARQGAGGAFDVAFVRGGPVAAGSRQPAVEMPRPEPPAPGRAAANDPLQGEFARRAVPDLRAHLGRRLPEHMVPAAFVLLRRMPLNRNGKVDRAALPEPERARPQLEAAFVRPQSASERAVAAVWGELLGLDRVGAEDDFFALGGHSLLATQVVSRLRRDLGVDVPLRTLFEAPTLAALAERIDRLQAPAAAGPPPLVPAPRGAGRPLSFAQERLWFLQQLHPESVFYNEPMQVELDGACHLAALGRALAETFRRHQVLRSRFPAVGERPVQIVAPVPSPPLAVADLSGLPRALRRPAADRLARRLRERPFDLATAAPVRAALVRLGSESHRLALVLHHLVIDGWSQEILRREVAALYDAFRHGEPSPLPPLELQYGDYAYWQRSWLRGEALEARLGYWRERLAGLSHLELPTDRPRPRSAGRRGGSLPVAVPPAVTAALRDLSRRHGTTLFMTLLAAFSVLLSRASGQEDVAVGSPVANRNRREVEDLVGFFVNMLVMRVAVGAEARLPEVLSAVRETAVGAYEHQDLPFEKLVEELRPERDPGRNPLFQVCFQLLTGRATRAATAAAPPDPETAVGAASAKFDLYLALVDRGERVDGFLEFDADLFDVTTVARLRRSFARLLEGMAEEPDRAVAELPLLVASERHQVLAEWGAGPAAGSEAPIHLLFREQAARRPEAVAAVQGPEHLSYAALAARAAELARRLRRLGVAAEEPVALLAGRGTGALAAILGILEAGGAYLPLDPEYPVERLALMVEEAGARRLFADTAVVDLARGLAERVPGLAVVAIDAPDEPAADPRAADLEPLPPVAPERLAYVMFTSGSTGRPKGVAVPHRAVARLVRRPSFARLEGSETILQYAPISFDASTLEIWGALANGGRLELAPSGPLAIEALGRLVAATRITTAWLTAALFQQVADGPLEPLASLRQLLAGGDVLPVAQVRRVLAALPGTRLINGYGPTENTTFTCCHPLTVEGRIEPSVPVGRPIAGTTAHVLDAGLRPLPAGAPGELFAGGDGLARGYLGRPGLTAERFLPDPVRGVPGARAYATGDRARHLASGEVEYLGRRDRQLKIRGFRVEPAEVEAVLAACPGVRQAAVVAVSRGGERRLVGYAAPADLVPEELEAHLRARLPEAMVPARVEVLDELPLTPSGKLDRGALPEPRWVAAGGRAGGAPARPLSPVEEAVAAVWREVLEVEDVGPGDDFFDLGGHSLLATRVVSRLRRDLGVEVPLAALFEAPTVAALAERVARALAAGGELSLPPLVPVDRSGDLPLSFAQERLWFFDQLQPGNPFYNMPLPVRLRGPLDLPVLARVLSEVVRRHEVLRTGFRAVGGRPRQWVAPAAPVAPPLVDLSGLGERRAEGEADRLARLEALLPFDLARPPLLRASVVRLAAADHVLLLDLHHVAADGWSMGVLVAETAALYGALAAGRPPELPDLAVQYGDYAAWQRAALDDDTLAALLAGWRETLAGHRLVLDLPTDRPRPPAQTLRGGREVVAVPAEVAEGLRRLAREHGATPFMALLAGFAALLERHSGDSDLLVGTPVANRDRPEIEPLIGFFVNTLVLRCDLRGDPAYAELLRRVRAVCLEAFGRAELPYERLVEELQPRRDLARNPVFQVMFALQSAAPARPELPGLDLEVRSSGREVCLFDLNVDFVETGGGLVGSFEYNRDVFDGVTVARMARQLVTLLTGMVGDPERPISAPALLAAGERHQVLAEWNDTGRSRRAEELTFLDRFRERVGEAPDRPAAESGDGVLTYGGLASRATRLAAALRGLGVGPEVPVAVLLDRGLEVAVALLGVLEAGGAFVPLDPEAPAERLGYVLADSGAAVVLTSGALRARLPAGADERVPIVEVAAAGVGPAPAAPAAAPDPGSAAYVIYTSGSTGRPKGSVVSHRSLDRYSTSAAAALGLAPADRFLQFAALAFDVLVEELFPVWTAGGSVVFAPSERLAVDELLDLLAERRVSAAELPTAFWHRWVHELQHRGASLPPSLRFVIIGGERVLSDRLTAWQRFRVPLVHVYGLTETTVTSTLHRPPLGREGEGAGAGLPIGRPLPDSRTHVLDGAGRPSPPGVPGELHVGGPFVGRGYLRRPALTAGRFVPDPFAGAPGARLYRTGDRARHLADGRLEFLGRLDHQVKLRGFRVEPGEVESALARHAGVRDVAVAVREPEPGDRRLVAYVVPSASTGDDLGPALRGHLAETLPPYMVPSAFVFLDALPLTATGKLDHRALPDPDGTRPGSEASYVAPRSPVEEELAGIVASVLGLDRVGVEDDFFALGGHSLLATQVIARIRESFEVDLPLRSLFEAPTVAALAVAVVERQVAGADSAAMAEALEDLARLSDEEIAALLAE